MKRLVAILLATSLALASAGVALGATGTPTSLTIRHSTAGGQSFAGKVRSTLPACVTGRRVTVYRKRKGADPALGSATSAVDGTWSVRPAGKLRTGDYYARTPAARRGGATCAAGRSVTTHAS